MNDGLYNLRTTFACPECGIETNLDECGVFGAEDGYVFCPECCGHIKTSDVLGSNMPLFSGAAENDVPLEVKGKR